MGMESFNELPEETQVPNESQRIEDLEKAQVMAGAKTDSRERAAQLRTWAEGDSENSDLLQAKAGRVDQTAGEFEDFVGHKFDIRKEHPDWDENQVTLEARKRSE